jgi:signal transduction histidine kinase
MYKVIDSGKHLLSLINDILDMSKIEAGMLKLLIDHDIALAQEINGVVPVAHTLLDDKPVEVVLELEPDLPLVTGDRRRIRQIMLNLISNACKFTETGTITLGLKQRENSLVFSVTDTGPGIAPEDQSLIFQTFRQTHTGMKRGEGTGLGLALSKHLAEAHGGQLWFESIAGKGSTFYFCIPLKKEVKVVKESS